MSTTTNEQNTNLSPTAMKAKAEEDVRTLAAAYNEAIASGDTALANSIASGVQDVNTASQKATQAVTIERIIKKADERFDTEKYAGISKPALTMRIACETFDYDFLKVTVSKTNKTANIGTGTAVIDLYALGAKTVLGEKANWDEYVKAFIFAYGSMCQSMTGHDTDAKELARLYERLSVSEELGEIPATNRSDADLAKWDGFIKKAIDAMIGDKPVTKDYDDKLRNWMLEAATAYKGFHEITVLQRPRMSTVIMEGAYTMLTGCMPKVAKK